MGRASGRNAHQGCGGAFGRDGGTPSGLESQPRPDAGTEPSSGIAFTAHCLHAFDEELPEAANSAADIGAKTAKRET